MPRGKTHHQTLVMFAEKHHPDKLSPKELDDYLARGWYRMGQTIFTTHFLCFGNRFYAAIWVRLPLAGYQFSKSLRKIIRRNSAHFQTTIAPAAITLEKEELYQTYRYSFPGMLSPSLQDSLLDGGDHNVYNTFEVTIREGDKLVACSFFDTGQDSAASILGFYDPAYSAYSLGLYTMLEEINFCRYRGMPFYYPGYVVPGYHRFDYKLRIGAVEYFDVADRHWKPYSELPAGRTPLSEMEEKLALMNLLLKAHLLPSRCMHYPLFEANLFGFWSAAYLEYPVFLLCVAPPRDAGYVIVVYDVRDGRYKLIRCVPFDDVGFYLNDTFLQNFSPEHFFTELIIVEEVLLQSANPEFIALALHKLRTLK